MTRNCPNQDFQFPTVTSFFSRRDILPPALPVHTLQRQTPVGHCLAITDLEQLGAQLEKSETRNTILSLLSPDEKKIFSTFTYPKRRTEWLGGRIAAKTAVTALRGDAFSAKHLSCLSILPSENGVPEIRAPRGKKAHVSLSISHSRQFAAGMASFAETCGLDLQKITGQTKKVLSRFAETEETSLLKIKLPDLDENQRLSLLWSAKEALKKSLFPNQPVLFQGVVLKTVYPGNLLKLCLQSPASGTHLSKVEAAVIGNYILAFTIHNASHARTP